jgi:hypothetical protein
MVYQYLRQVLGILVHLRRVQHVSIEDIGFTQIQLLLKDITEADGLTMNEPGLVLRGHLGSYKVVPLREGRQTVSHQDLVEYLEIVKCRPQIL